MNATSNRQTLIDEANAKRNLAAKAHKAGDIALRDAYLTQARDRYTAAGLDGTAKWCDRFIGK